MSAISAIHANIADPNARRIMIAAHRGTWTSAPENSLPALEACVALGVEVMEIDVQLTADRQLVVFHDQSLERMTDGKGLLKDRTLAELKALRFYERDGAPTNIWKRKLLTNVPVATLAEIFEAARGRVMLNLEIKSNDEFSFVEVFNASAELARQMQVADHVLWKIPAGKRAYELDIVPGFAGDAGPDTSSATIVERLDTTGLTHLAPMIWEAARSFTQQLGDFAAHANVPVFEIVAENLAYWPVGEDGRLPGSDRYCHMAVAVLPQWCAGLADDLALRDPDAAWGRLIELGARIIMTDRPEQLLAYLQAIGRR